MYSIKPICQRTSACSFRHPIFDVQLAPIASLNIRNWRPYFQAQFIHNQMDCYVYGRARISRALVSKHCCYVRAKAMYCWQEIVLDSLLNSLQMTWSRWQSLKSECCSPVSFRARSEESHIFKAHLLQSNPSGDRSKKVARDWNLWSAIASSFCSTLWSLFLWQ